MGTYDVMESNFNEFLATAEKIVEKAAIVKAGAAIFGNVAIINVDDFNHFSKVVKRISKQLKKFEA